MEFLSIEYNTTHPHPHSCTHHTHHTPTHTHPHTGGVPSQGGDYISELGNFIFTPGNNRACLDVFVFQDLMYELTEDLIVRVGGFINPQGNQVPALSGVTVRPDMSTILIMDSNGEWA